MNELAILAVTFAMLLAGGAVLTVRQLRKSLARLKDEQRELRSAASRAQMLQVLFESSDDGLFVCDALGDIKAANAAAGKLIGVSRKEIVGSTITDWVRHGAARSPAAAGAGAGDAGFPLADGEAELRHQRKGVAIRVRVDVQASQAGQES